MSRWFRAERLSILFIILVNHGCIVLGHSNQLRQYSRFLLTEFERRFPYTPRPFACKGGGAGGGVVNKVNLI